jgi:hypothetical protein
MLVITIVKMIIGLATKGTWSSFDEGLNRFAPIVLDIQFLFGIIIWLMLVIQAWSSLPLAIKLEHPITMIIAIVVAHITSRRVKSASTDAAKYQTGTIGYAIALVIVILGYWLIMSVPH